MPEKAVYIGDSIYADTEGGQMRVYTNNGTGPKNVIMVGPQEARDLIRFFEKCYPGLLKTIK